MAHSRRVARRPALPAVLVAAMTLSLAACGPDEQVTEAVTDSSTPIATASSGGGGESGSAPATIESAAPVVGTVWVANEDGDSLTAIDAATGDVVATIDGIDGPHNVQVGPDGNTIWAVSGHASALVAVDARTSELLGTAPTGPSPAHVIVSPDGSNVYVTNAGDDSLSVFDAAALEPKATLSLSAGPHGLRPTPDGAFVVVANTTAGAVDIVDTASNTVAASVPVGDSPAQVAVDAEGRYAYASLNGSSEVVKIDLEQRKAVGTVAVPSPPVQLYLTADGSRLLSADQGTEDAPGRTVSIIDPASLAVEASVETGAGPHGIVIEPTGQRAWVTNLYDDTVSAIDLTTGKVVATAPVGDKPNGISYSAAPPTEGLKSTSITVPEYGGGGGDHAEH